ncbi:exodeoxyribonuclease V subunit beta [Pedobacter sp. SYSU D00535]|uniref:UvrD-helicase domain-containing protein n=1 Tax=Pedobacter sp. SYSU D00535 TaxID=2810308 RepID=UPI001A968412|nr:UvrD-helicase domain-containing protein [Pedobacter sp. SYSU D00535]
MQHKPLKILQASAGSGKTFSLTAHYLTLLFSSETKYREILAVTFTNKATEEMKSRILEVLKGLALGEQSVKTFRDIILQSHPDLNEGSIQEKAHAIYRRILHDYSRFAVNTIDGFVQKVIRSFSFELGLDAGYKLEMNTDKVKRELAAKLNDQLEKKPELLQWIINLALERVRDNKSWNYRETLINLADEIFKERYHPFEEALKSHDPDTLFKDLQQLTKELISYFESAIMELAREAVHIFRESGVLIEMLKGKSRSPLNNLTKIADGDYAKITGLQKMIDEPEEWQKGGMDGNISALYAQLNPVLRDLVDFYGKELPQYQMAKALNANLYYLRLMQEMAGLMKEYRQENGALMISDAQNLLRGITAEQIDNPSFIWEKMGNRYRHFLFDEFQDTSSFQWLNFLPLLRNAVAEADGKLIDHLIVGDVKQSIYRWRNGDWRILHSHAKKNIGDQRVLDDSLKENYRSAANIIEFNNFLFKHAPTFLQNHINAKVIEDGGAELFENWWRTEGLDNIICSAYEQSYQQKAPSTPAGGSVQVSFIPVTDNRTRGSESKDAALQKLAEQLNEWISSGRYKAGQICILVRSNGEARSVIETLMKDQQQREQQHLAMGVNTPWKPYEVLSGEALLIANNSAVRLIINTLYAMVAKRDQNSLYKSTCIHLYNKELKTKLNGDTWLKLNSTEPEKLAGYLPEALCKNWQSWQQLPLFELIEQLIGAYQLDTIKLHLPYLIAFRDMVSSFTKQGERGISSFLNWWEEEGTRKALPSSEQSDAVQVMTIHKSKGLAFDVVMIPFCCWNLDGMSNSIFWVDALHTPYSMLNSVPVHYKKSLGQSAFAKAYFEELLFNYMDALNMLYVATTRTRNHLFISAPAQVSGKDDQFSLAGDLIFRPLQTYASELNVEFDEVELLIDEPVVKEIRSAGTKAENDDRFIEKKWSFSSYPLSNRLEDALTDKKVFEQLDLLSGNTSQRRGIILHDLLSRVRITEELPDVLKKMQAEGLFRQSEEKEILDLAESVLLQPDLKALLEKPYESLSEQTIINGRGESYRPDKVLIGKDEVVIIDFKFTGEPKPQHYDQVDAYKGLLAEMGYKNIKAYLYYGYLKELKAV